MMKYGIEINEKWCKSCGLCAAFCPKGVFSLAFGGSPVAEHPEICVGCGTCELKCPHFAIQVEAKQ